MVSEFQNSSLRLLALLWDIIPDSTDLKTQCLRDLEIRERRHAFEMAKALYLFVMEGLIEGRR